MIINKNDELLDYINTIIDTKEMNIAVADMLLHAFNCKDLINLSELNYLIKEEGYIEKDAIIKLLFDAFEIDVNNDESQFVIQNYLTEIHHQNISNYLENDYVKNIKIKPFKKGKYSLKYCSYQKYQLFPLDEISIDKTNFMEISSIGYFDKKYDYIALFENDVIWMCITPNEINTMKEPIKRAKGRVLVLGLGLGYYPYMVSLKNDVDEVVVIEKDNAIIDIFEKNIRPHIPNSKIKIINADAYDYLNNCHGHDCVFADLWHNPEDGISHYIKLKSFEKNLNIPFYYWLEPSLKQMFRRCLITIIQEYFEGYTIDNYLFSENEIDTVINKIFITIQDIQINNINDLKSLFSNENILSIIEYINEKE